jgi:redox-sensitive bicupin YhaK (pirin superfamily)
VISGDGGDAVLVHQDAHVFLARLNPGVGVEHPLRPSRGVYLYVIDGEVEVNGEGMATGDAAQLADEDAVRIQGSAVSELVLVDVDLRA